VRILYVTRQVPPQGVGGIGTYVMVLAAMMRDAGHEVTVLCASPGARRATEERDGIVVEHVPALGPGWLWRALDRRSQWAASRLHGALSAAWALLRLRRSFDVVEAPEWKAEGLLLRWCRRGPVVVHLHLAQELVRRWSGGPWGRGVALAEAMERTAVRRAAAVTAASELSRTLPDGQRWLPSTAVTRVPPPLDVDRWSACPAVDGTGPLVLFVGHLERRKAPEVLVEALGLLAGDVTGLRAVFVGRAFAGPGPGPGRYDDFVRAETARLGVPCEVLPPRPGADAMGDLYARARVVAVPSRFETLSMVALEGLASGRPVVMTDAVGAAEWVGDSVPGVVVPVDDPVALAAALRPLLLDAGEAARVGRAGRRAVAEACAAEEVVARRVAVYAAAVTSRGSTRSPDGARC
jgi:glycogen synthase